jgi:hypothetical protein
LFLSNPIFKTHLTPPPLSRMRTTALWVFRDSTRELNDCIKGAY